MTKSKTHRTPEALLDMATDHAERADLASASARCQTRAEIERGDSDPNAAPT